MRHHQSLPQLGHQVPPSSLPSATSHKVRRDSRTNASTESSQTTPNLPHVHSIGSNSSRVLYSTWTATSGDGVVDAMHKTNNPLGWKEEDVVDLTRTGQRSSVAASGNAARIHTPANSKLAVEVDRLTARGQALIKKEGCEPEGIHLLGKALWARAKFPVLQRDGDLTLWEHAEAFVVTCNQLASRLMFRFSPSAAAAANAIFGAAEVALQVGGEELDCFAGFQPLRSFLVGQSLNTIATLQRLNREPPEAIVVSLERALRVEGGRLSTLTLFNLAAVYVQTRRFDDAMASVTCGIELANHYLSLPVVNETESRTLFAQSVATHATLSHLLIASLASWTGSLSTALHHARLAHACAKIYLGEYHALTTRSRERVETILRKLPSSSVTTTQEFSRSARRTERLSSSAEDPTVEGHHRLNANTGSGVSATPTAAYLSPGVAQPQDAVLRSTAITTNTTTSANDDEPPLIPLQAAMLMTTRHTFPPSHLLPFALAFPLPKSVTDFVSRVAMQPQAQHPRRLGGSGGSGLLPKLTATDESVRGTGEDGGDDGGAVNQFLGSWSLGPETTSLSQDSGSLRGTVTGARLASPGEGKSGASSSKNVPARVASTPPERGRRSNRAAAGDAGSGATAGTTMPPVRPTSFLGTPTTGSTNNRGPPLSSSEAAMTSVTGAPVPTASLPPPPPLVPRPPQSSSSLPSSRDGSRPTTRGRTDSLAAAHGSASTLLPSPAAISANAVTSIIPKAELQLYERIQREVQAQLWERRVEHFKRALPPTAAKTATTAITPSSLLFGRQGAAALAPAPSLHRSPMFPAEAPHRSALDALVASDGALRTLSILRPDHTDQDEVVWARRATDIQRVFRSFWVRKHVVAPRRADVARYLLRLPSAERLWDAWKAYQLRKEAIAEKRRRRRLRVLNHAATIVQSCARQANSERELLARWNAAVAAERERRRLVRLRESAACMIQSWARGNVVRRVLRKRALAAVTVQRTWKIFRLYVVMRRFVFQLRIRRRALAEFQSQSAARVQLWFRRVLPLFRAQQVLRRRQQELERYLLDFLEKDRDYWKTVRHLDDDECRNVVRRWASGYLARKRLNQQRLVLIARTRATKVIQRWYRFAHTNRMLNHRVEEHHRRFLLQRRVEEVREAVFDLVRVGRGFVARTQVHQLQVQKERRHRAARTIQNATRRMLRRGVLRAKREQHRLKVFLYERSEVRQFSAKVIQSAWRMHRDVKFVAEFRSFMRVVRHEVATKIQTQVRAFVARRRVAKRREEVRGRVAERQTAECRQVAARRIQCVARMMLARVALASRYARSYDDDNDDSTGRHGESEVQRGAIVRRSSCRRIFPTAYRRNVAATTIQSYWRRFAAAEYVQQLRTARMCMQSHHIHEEHLHTYAIVLQCFARRYILTANRVAEARRDRAHRAVLRIQRAAKQYLDRKRVFDTLLAQEEEALLQLLREEHQFAATRIQKMIKGRLTKWRYDRVKRAAVVIQAWMRGTLARLQRRALKEHREAAAAAVQMREEAEAATLIQRSWRHGIRGGRGAGSLHSRRSSSPSVGETAE